MKNSTLLRATCGALFGVLFLSPAIKKDNGGFLTRPPVGRDVLAAAGFLASNTSYFTPNSYNGALLPQLFGNLLQPGISPIPDPVLASLMPIKASLLNRPAECNPVEVAAASEVVAPPVSSPTETMPPRKQRTQAAPAFAFASASNLRPPIITREQEDGDERFDETDLQQRIDQLYQHAAANGCSKQYAFLVNLGMKSGKKRFLVIDLQSRSVAFAGLVAHGRGKERFTLDRSYSNRPGSGCSSLGLYRVGDVYSGSFGYSFKLFGLQKSNNNAFRRAIVLHAMNCIPDVEIDYPICQSEGCPSVSPYFLGQLNEIIRQSEKPVLLWMFDQLEEGDQL